MTRVAVIVRKFQARGAQAMAARGQWLKGNVLAALVMAVLGGVTRAQPTSEGMASNVSFEGFTLRRRYSTPDIAFTTNVAIPGVGGPGEVDYSRPNQTMPGLNAHLFLTEEWGIGGSFRSSPTFTQTFG